MRPGEAAAPFSGRSGDGRRSRPWGPIVAHDEAVVGPIGAHGDRRAELTRRGGGRNDRAPAKPSAPCSGRKPRRAKRARCLTATPSPLPVRPPTDPTSVRGVGRSVTAGEAVLALRGRSGEGRSRRPVPPHGDAVPAIGRTRRLTRQACGAWVGRTMCARAGPCRACAAEAATAEARDPAPPHGEAVLPSLPAPWRGSVGTERRRSRPCPCGAKPAPGEVHRGVSRDRCGRRDAERRRGRRRW